MIMLAFYSVCGIIILLLINHSKGIKQMVRLTTAEAMQKAIDKARAVKPLVRVLSFGNYTVTNKQTGATYTVTCEKRNGGRFADCNCKAGAATRAASGADA